MTYNDPGLLFLKSYGKVESVDDVLAYVEFLRKESKLNGKVPVILEDIFRYFDIPTPILSKLPDIQGLLVDPMNGVIVINSEDQASRQKFTLAHELIEILFNVLPEGKDIGNGWKLLKPGGFNEFTKENLCNLAAASLLMPVDYIKKQINCYGVNLECARIISAECEVSLSASLVQLARLSPNCHAIVLWKMKNKPSEIKNKIPDAQLSFFEEKQKIPLMKLRVVWSMGNTKAFFIPKGKSIEESTLIFSAWQSGVFTSGRERLCLDGKLTKSYLTQNLPFRNNGEFQVLSLIEDLGFGNQSESSN